MAVIPSETARSTRIPRDGGMYKQRHLIENFFFCRIMALRRIATHYKKTDACFVSLISLVTVFLWAQ